MSDPRESPTGRRASNFAVEQRDQAAVVIVEGDLDLLSAPRLKGTLTSLLGAGSRLLVLDFGGVTFMDSTALSVLIGVHRQLGPDERMAIAGARAEVLRVFELSGLVAAFEIFPSVDAAAAHVTSGAPSAGACAPPLTADAALRGPVGEGIRADAPGGDPVANVTEHAARIATQRRAAKVATTDIPLAVMHVYGDTFGRVLAAHGVGVEELAERVAAAA
jgi:anti-sigma B factor antagonist